MSKFQNEVATGNPNHCDNNLQVQEDSHTIDATICRKIRSFYEPVRSVVSKITCLDENSKLIMIVDDEPLMFQLIEEFLGDADINCELITATNGDQAFEIAESLMPDLIISDWLIPGMNGLGLTRKLKGNAFTQNIPVILTTGAITSDEQIDEFFDAGAVDYIKKPIDFSELKTRVRAALVMAECKQESKFVLDSFDIQHQLVGYLIDRANVPIFCIDANGALLVSNSRFESLFRLTKEDIFLKPFYEFLPASISDVLEIYMSGLSAETTNREFETKLAMEAGPKHLSIVLMRFGRSSHPLIVGEITDKNGAPMTVRNEERHHFAPVVGLSA